MAYAHYFTITIDHTKVGESDHTNFPMLFTGIFPDLRTTENGGYVESEYGYDIVFSSDSDGSSLLDWEIESWDGETGEIVAWVKVPSLSHESDTVIYLCYGDSGVSSDQSDQAGTWSNGYAAVYHMGSAASFSGDDSTGTNDGTPTNVTASSGFVRGGAGFSGTGQVRISENASLKPSYITVEAWAKPSTRSNWQYAVSMAYRDSGWTGPYMSYALQQNAGDQWVFGLTVGGSLAQLSCDAGFVVNGWHYVVGTYDGSTQKCYVNGVLSTNTRSVSGVVDCSTCKDLVIGNRSPYSAGERFNGIVDEVRISNVARSADWILAQYNNMVCPAQFYAVSNGDSTSEKRRSITIDHTKVGSSDTDDYPLLFAGTYQWLSRPPYGGGVGRHDGNDIYFALNESGSQLLDFEREHYDESGKCAFWIRIPTVSHDDDTVIYIFYGNADHSEDVSSPEDVWDSNYTAVYHCGDRLTGPPIADSSGSGNDLNSTSITPPHPSFDAPIVRGVRMWGNSILRSSSFSNLPAATGPITEEAWFRCEDTPNQQMISLGDNANVKHRFGMVYGSSGYLGVETYNHARGFAWTRDGNRHHLVAKQPSGSTANIRMFLDGIEKTTSLLTGSDGDLNLTVAQIRMGDLPVAGTQPWHGEIDEVRISKVERSDDYITACYNNQSSPSTFYAVGDEEEGGVSGSPWYAYAQQ